MDLLLKKGKQVILGDEAIVRGALEAGVNYVSTYPGTPASEIGDTFAKIGKKAGVYFEYATNEKVALESAAGAALSNLRALVPMKHFGVNVASDSLFPLSYLKVKGLVFVFSDDPGSRSGTQSEQDSRYYARMANMPMLEPSTVQECKDFTKLAFELSDKYETPILIRLTTQICHSNAAVDFKPFKISKKRGTFKKDLYRFNSFAPDIIRMHQEVIDKLNTIRQTDLGVNAIVRGKSGLGIITSGPVYSIVKDVVDELKLDASILKLGMTWPIPNKLITDFAKDCDKILVVEELDGVLEKEVRSLVSKEIHGKNLIPSVDTLKPEHVVFALSKISDVKYDLDKNIQLYESIKPVRRKPFFCPGCPHMSTFTALKKVAPDAIYSGDIGCYFLSMGKPFETMDFMVAMGASQGIGHGISKATRKKVITLIGDSTFFHAGIPGIINIVENHSDPLIVVLDNSVAAMTGTQPRPQLKIEKVAEACGIKEVRVVDAFNTKDVATAVKELINKKEPTMIVSRGLCRRIKK